MNDMKVGPGTRALVSLTLLLGPFKYGAQTSATDLLEVFRRLGALIQLGTLEWRGGTGRSRLARRA